MPDDVTITSDEFAAVAAKVDADASLDDHDKTVLRALFQLAGERVADLAGSEVSGFSFDPGPQGVGGSLSFNFPAEVAFTKKVDTSSAKLFLSCCTGEHIKQATITV
jgi:Type VI secretion system effector, Hcp